jgi:hypothetical protein
MGARNYYFLLGFTRPPAAASEMTMNAIAAHVNALLCVLTPMARKTIPRIRKTAETFRRFIFMIYPFK